MNGTPAHHEDHLVVGTAVVEPSRPHRRSLRVGMLGAAIGVTAALLVVFALPDGTTLSPQSLGVAMILAVGFGLAELVVLHFEIGDQAHSASLSEIPLVIGLFVADPRLLLVARVVGAALALRLHRRQTLVKLGFNLSQFSLEAVTAVLIFRAVSDHRSGLLSYGAAALAALVASLMNSIAVLGAISLTQGSFERQGIGGLLRTASVSAITNAAVALVGISLVRSDPIAAVPLAVVGGMLAFAYRSHVRLRDRLGRLSSLYEFIRSLSGSAGSNDITRAVLKEARRLLKSEVASLTLLEPGDEDDDSERQIMRYVLAADGRMRRETVEVGPSEWLWSRTWSTGQPVLVARGDRDPDKAAYARSRGERDLVIVALPSESGVRGTLSVGSRRGEFSTFTAEDVQVLTGVANHGAVALANGHLVDRLTYESRHDALTGLPNRVEFAQQLAAELRGGSDAERDSCAVLLMDLDRFKDVNDTLGHHAGDILLEEVAVRLRECLRSDGLVARLGGDEFAVLLPGATLEAALVVADRISATLTRPVAVESLQVDVGVSIGIAVAPQHGVEAGVLLRCADIAMYDAKVGAGIDVYDPQRDDSSASRLALVAELRTAIVRGELELFYQPKARCADGHVDGVEALLRWHHPERGDVPPDEFIPLAERSGMLHDITRWVVLTALDQVVTWRGLGREMAVSVNLSPRDLLDVALPDVVADELFRRHLEPSVLTLEITEGTIMADPERALDTLRRLRAVGVRLSVDDFGTGYSSLAYLKRLPIAEVKIDKSFVREIDSDEQDLAIVQAICALATSLGLEVVAEGVEDLGSWRRLADLGCDYVQGWQLARPMPGTAVLDWLGDRDGGPGPANHIVQIASGSPQDSSLAR